MEWIYNGDCFEFMQQLIDSGVKVDAIITDPPYELENHGGTKAPMAKRAAKVRDEIEFIANDFDFEKISDELIRICKTPNIIMFCSALQLGRTIVYFENKGYRADVLVWSKSNPAPLSNGKYISDIEYIVYVHTKGSPWNNNTQNDYKKKTKIYPIITNQMDKIHPTQKPVELLSELIMVHSFENDIVLDCFSGSGSTAVACHNLKRKFICIEKDKDYYEASVKRVEDAQKQLTLF